MISANIFDIKRFGVHDGGGIRTVLFVKGCPLRCRWCQNPEGLDPNIQLWWHENSCVHCEGCVQACKRQALQANKEGILIDHEKCNLCLDCVRECPTGALRPNALEMTVEQAVREIEKDMPFYGELGGVTLSGGECTMAPEFSLAVLAACKKRGIHTCIETSMHTNSLIMQGFVQATDRMIVDLKLFDAKRHKEATGVDNSLILKNFNYVAKHKKEVLVRIPLIPGYTADEKNITEIALFIKSINDSIPIELLNYNPMCVAKYKSMHQTMRGLETAKAFSKEELERFAELIRKRGIAVKY